MQTPERLQELSEARGADADRLFFEIMIDHHFGGVHMADHAAANGPARRSSRSPRQRLGTQRYEVVEYRNMMERLGLS
jgi:uncharacterized protein (DUF305 family)